MGGPRLTCSEHRWERTRLRAGGVEAGHPAMGVGVVGEGVGVSILSLRERERPRRPQREMWWHLLLRAKELPRRWVWQRRPRWRPRPVAEVGEGAVEMAMERAVAEGVDRILMRVKPRVPQQRFQVMVPTVVAMSVATTVKELFQHRRW